MLRKYYRVICFIFVFLIAYTGICLDTIQTDSFFEYNTLHNRTSVYITSEDSTLKSEEACTQQMLGITQSTFINHVVERNHVQPNTKGILWFFTASLCSIGFVFLHMVKDNKHLSYAYCRTVILKYIHNKDGKK